jgi:acetoin utilization protein AcuB
MVVADIMSHRIVTVASDDRLSLLQSRFNEYGFRHLLVMEGTRLAGIVSDRDLLRAVSPFAGDALLSRSQDEATLDRRAHQIMTRRVVTASPETSIPDVTRLMLEHRVSCVPVLSSENRLVGLVTTTDVIRALLEEGEKD